ncbi:hypothetical protein BBP40_005025 [Aspergillus hancockii]|nr:hypothetical protein BBP40_005025 [Aspergillus hancockii]
MANVTSTASASATTMTTRISTLASNPTSVSSTAAAATSTAASKTGLMGSQVGGIVGGVVGGVLIFGIVALVSFSRRRRAQTQAVPDTGHSGLDGPVDGGEKDVPMLGGNMRQEMDGQGGSALHEMGGLRDDGGKGIEREGVSELEGERTVVAELDGGFTGRNPGAK